jgi:hypothetical protein
MATPGPSFEADIKPLFRSRDRGAMTFLFDLWNRADVEANATAILDALEGGDMPCDEPWPADRIALLRAWANGGFQP